MLIEILEFLHSFPKLTIYSMGILLELSCCKIEVLQPFTFSFGLVLYEGKDQIWVVHSPGVSKHFVLSAALGFWNDSRSRKGGRG